MADRWTAVGTCQCPFFAYVALQVQSPGSIPQTARPHPSSCLPCWGWSAVAPGGPGRRVRSHRGLGSYLDSDAYWQL